MNVWTAAMRSASQGMRVFPVHGIISPGATEAEAHCTCGNRCESPGKHPVKTRWQEAATTDLDVINKWFAGGSGRENYGIALDGRDWTVVEVDPYDGGSLRALRDFAGELGPITTSGRAHHAWFKGTNLRNGTKIGLGMTIRAAGYYVVGPGSTHYTGRRYGRRAYGFDRIDVRPDLVVATFRSSSLWHALGSPLAVPKKLPEEIFDGEGRWRHLLSVAGTMVSRGLTEATVLEVVRALNRNHCRPPKSDDDVVRLVRWVIEHDGRRRAAMRTISTLSQSRAGRRSPSSRTRSMVKCWRTKS
jgi:putative DNA primase/helicase